MYMNFPELLKLKLSNEQYLRLIYLVFYYEDLVCYHYKDIKMFRSFVTKILNPSCYSEVDTTTDE